MQKRSNFFSTWHCQPHKVLLQREPNKINASNGPVTFLHQKEYLITTERNISKVQREKGENNAPLFKT
jgi:hypothetical protein